MGYCISLNESKFNMKKENLPAALEALKSLAKKNKNLSWVYSGDVINSETFEEAMAEFRYEVVLDENGNVTFIDFTGEKFGSDDLMFSAIAPFVESGSYIEMCGEDGEFWMWKFKDGKFKEVQAKRVYEDED